MVLNGIAQFKELNYYDQDFYQRIVIIEANTYRDIQHFDKAIKLYNKMLKKT